MAEQSMAFAEYIRQHGGEDFLRGVVERVLTQLMDYEVGHQIGAGLHERSGERQAYRNGYRERILHTRLGTLALPIPKLRAGSYFPSFLEPRRLSEPVAGRHLPQGPAGRAGSVGGGHNRLCGEQ